MTDTTVPVENDLDAPTQTQSQDQAARQDRTRSAAVLRSVWRIHFYAAFIAAPFLVLQILTGLVIMYTHPIMGVLHGDVMRVEPADQTVSLAQQRVAADAAAPEGSSLEAVNTPKEIGDATAFQYPMDDGRYLDVYVDPHTGEVTGTHVNGEDLVGLANRLHGYLNAQEFTIPLPSLAHLIDPDSGELVQDYVVGDLVLEIAAGWALVLTLAGLFLWWPRRTQKGKALLRPRLRKKGLIRWRDLHAVSGILAIAALLLFLTTGLPWSGYWGQTWSTVASTVTHGEGPFAAGFDASTPSEVGDLDRFGNLIPWAQQETPIPGSETAGAGVPSTVNLSVVERAAAEEGMLPGYSIYLPTDSVAEDGSTSYGSYTLMNFWPRSVADEKTVVLDQFSGETILVSDAGDYGFLQQATSMGISTHMGTEFGLANTIWITLSCVLVLLAILSAVVMWWIRRPSGSAGLPKRPASPSLAASVLGVMIALMVVYPLWGVTALAVLVVDKLVVQRVPALRRAVGMPAKG